MINGKIPGVCPSHHWIDRVNNYLNKSTQGVTIANSVDRDRWRNGVEAAKFL
jgi:hypothetical protein